MPYNLRKPESLARKKFTPSVKDETDPTAHTPEMRRWIEDRLRKLQKQKGGLAKALRVANARVTEIIAGTRQIKTSELGPLAAYLELDEDEVLRLVNREKITPTHDTKQTQDINLSSTPLADAFPFKAVDVPPRASMPPTVPVYGVAEGGTVGDFELNNTADAVDYVRRPPGIANAKDVYAIYVVGDSMAPRFEPGELIYIDPHRPARSGHDVIVQLHADNPHAPVRCLLKRLVRRTPTQLVVAQFNPAHELAPIPLAQVKAVHRVLTASELLGV